MAYEDEEKDLTSLPTSRKSSSSQDLEESRPLAGGHGDDQRYASPLKRRRRCSSSIAMPPNDSVVWKYWAMFTTALSAILLVGNIISSRGTALCPTEAKKASSALSTYPHPVETWKSDNLIQTQYYRDTRYMTLDRNADWLWQEYLLMSTGNIRLPDGKGNTSLKSISM